MKKKKMALLACALCLSLLTACGGQAGGSDVTDEDTPAGRP